MGSGIQLNGLGNDYILILVNGKRMNGNIGGQNDLNIINMANIERIEIVKGAASSLYGSHAIAGVINIITKKIGINSALPILPAPVPMAMSCRARCSGSATEI